MAPVCHARFALRARRIVVLRAYLARAGRMMASVGDDKVFESRIGKGTRISGTLNFRATVKIEGEAEGDITGDEVVIAEGAVVSARITAARLVVAGVLSGEVAASERIELLPTARVRCTLSTRSLVLNEGAQFDGECRMPRNLAAVQATA